MVLLVIMLVFSWTLVYIISRIGDSSLSQRARAGWINLVLALSVPFFLITTYSLLLQTVLNFAATRIWLARKSDARPYFVYVAGSTLLAYALIFSIFLWKEHELSELRKDYPFVSMETRLVGEKPISPPHPLDNDLHAKIVEQSSRFHDGGLDRHYFILLHEDINQAFVQSIGFGAGRMILVNREKIERYRNDLAVPMQPNRFPKTDWSPGESQSWLMPVASQGVLDDLLLDSTVNFARPLRGDYFKDRQHVAGFQPHQFYRFPNPISEWSIDSLELVSLLLHRTPVVYLSDHLPSMVNVHKLSTRPLDRFEEVGLPPLIDGGMIYLSETADEMRMLGAVRASESCMGCHDAKLGDLLGAFSYRLRATGNESRNALEKGGE